MGNRLDVSFEASMRKGNNCICRCCHGTGKVLEIQMPETAYFNGEPLRTRYEPFWICDSCAEKLDTALQTRSNRQLTLEELRGMVTQWVWVVVNYEHDGLRIQTDGWGLVSTPAVVACLDQLLPTDFYGRKFVAYRRKPAETEEEKHGNY